MCALCGTKLGAAPQRAGAPVAAPHTAGKTLVRDRDASRIPLALAASEMNRLDDHTRAQLLQKRKLCLVLDLDHTLIHATPVPLQLVRPHTPPLLHVMIFRCGVLPLPPSRSHPVSEARDGR